MILEFSISNFFSFKDKVTFSMIASPRKELIDNCIEEENKKILKTAAIYGANASGKTNIIKVLTTVVMMLRNSNNISIIDKLPIVPFKFDKEYSNQPSGFEIKFTLDGVRYIYGFTADINKVYEEYLYYYPNNRVTKIFDRTNGNKYSFSRDDNKLLKEITIKNADNKFFIATATNWNYELTKKPFEFLTNCINTITNMGALREAAVREYLNNFDALKTSALEFLQNSDFNITDFEVFKSELPDEVFATIPDFLKAGMREKPEVFNVFFQHKNSDKLLSLDEESIGTQIIFMLIPFVLDALNNKKVIFVDELDRSLHPFLVEMIVQMFNNSETNKTGAQLIFNTHDTNLLDLNIMRRDQIWFTEKNNENGVSDLYSLNDFSPLTRDNISKGYLLGKYGAIPFINNDYNLW